ncbi:MAG TPA: hypothetical protein ENL34_11030 [Chloroflexi bacterium]|nr:hypothetical protein [Chloroflexota bacterium]
MDELSGHFQKPRINPAWVNVRAVLPYGLTVDEILEALQAAYDFFHDVNSFLIGRGYSRLEDILLGNSFAGFLSEVLVKEIDRASKSLVRNTKVGGHPDLLPVGVYDDTSVLRGTDGIEIKSSKQRGGWQGHNPEAGWVMVFRYIIDIQTEPPEARRPTEIVQILAANLELSDWNFSGRLGRSRRTITASINKDGVHKLRSNPVYQHPDYVVKPRLYALTSE